ncbi:thioredoxin family protein [Aurantibacter sp.]|uniref:thioredoxin family protein n=1 Tax=Aurantibacter sp. TaxID=2807103 RepID=UPI0035C80CD2
METATLQLQDIIKSSLNKSIDYTSYRNLVHQLVEEKSNSGNEKTEALADYTMLNDRRMKRWDKTIKISESTQQYLTNYTKKITFLVITESWCGDAAHVIPVLNKITNSNPNLDLKLVFRDENDALMDNFLTNGGRAIAKLIALDEQNKVLFTFGPRPSLATKLVNDYKSKNGALTPEFKEDLQHWYNKDKGQSIINDLVMLLGNS